MENSVAIVESRHRLQVMNRLVNVEKQIKESSAAIVENQETKNNICGCNEETAAKFTYGGK